MKTAVQAEDRFVDSSGTGTGALVDADGGADNFYRQKKRKDAGWTIAPWMDGTKKSLVIADRCATQV